MSTHKGSIHEEGEVAAVDENTSLKQRVKQLKAYIQTHVSTLSEAYSSYGFTGTNPFSLPDFSEANIQQKAHAQESLWRIGAGVTSFRVRDPDPRAVDSGAVLGIRFEIVRSGRFLQPYVVLLNRPYGGDDATDVGASTRKSYLRVHRHTIPNCIPLGGLAARYLPPPTTPDVDDGEPPVKQREQHLNLFVKELRQRLVAYHNRLAAVADMRKAAGLGAKARERKRKRGTDRTVGDESAVGPGSESAEENSQDDEEEQNDRSVRQSRIVEIKTADAEAKQVEIHWVNGDVARLVIGAAGEVEKCVMYGRHGRDVPAAREFLQRITRVERIPDTIRRTADGSLGDG